MVHHTDKMRAVEFIGKPNDMVVESVHIPKIQDPLDAIIRVTSAGICGTDLHILHGRFGAQPPLTMGHETVGIVEAVGAGVTTIKVGDRVGVYDGVCCGFCANCVKGLTAYCLTLGQDFIGLGEPVGSKTPQNNGGQGESISVCLLRDRERIALVEMGKRGKEIRSVGARANT
jgi:glutathione-independent formaldehyde dehydrogenase